METISGVKNNFKFIGTYNPETETFEVGTPADINDFIFDIDDEGICFVTTNQNFDYDEETGCFYLIKEVK